MSAQPKPTSTSYASNMVLGQLMTNDVTDARVIDAIATTEREHFIPDHLKGVAYVDEDLDMGDGRYLLAPLTFARLLNIATITPECRVLDVGCLCGYSAAVLAKLAAHVVAIDIEDRLVSQAKQQLKDIANIDLQTVKTLTDGYGMSSPYDVIIIEGAISYVPEVLGLQLALGGRMATVFSKEKSFALSHGIGKAMLIKRMESALQYREHFDATASILPGFEHNTEFTL